jgi:hypothetical protein
MADESERTEERTPASKPPAHELREKMANHVGLMFQKVPDDLPAMSDHPEKCMGVKKACGVMHKAMSNLLTEHGKEYKGLKMPDLPDELASEEEAKPEPGTKEADEMDADLPEDEADLEDDLDEDAAKAWQDELDKGDAELALLKKDLAELAAK